MEFLVPAVRPLKGLFNVVFNLTLFDLTSRNDPVVRLNNNKEHMRFFTGGKTKNTEKCR